MDNKTCSSSVSILGGSPLGGAALFVFDLNGKTIFYILIVIDDVKRKSFQISFFLVARFLHFQIVRIIVDVGR
jgi:hypothetical protein